MGLLPVAGVAVGAALHPLIIALERARQLRHTGHEHGQYQGRRPHPHRTRLLHRMLAGAGVGGGISLFRALQHVLQKKHASLFAATATRHRLAREN